MELILLMEEIVTPTGSHIAIIDGVLINRSSQSNEVFSYRGGSKMQSREREGGEGAGGGGRAYHQLSHLCHSVGVAQVSRLVYITSYVLTCTNMIEHVLTCTNMY